MNTKHLAIKAENISKCYRIGLKEDMHDTFGASIWNALKSPLKNYRKYRALYKFGDIDSDHGHHPDILWALRDVSFEVKVGEIVGVIGLNGAGKSTLLKILSRITEPTSGRILLRGKVSSLLEVGTGFHPELTGRENVYLNGTILGMAKKEIDKKFDEMVDFSGVEKFIDTPVKRYSSGMRLRLAFAVAAYLEPEILLIDEVLAVGDAQFQKKCLNKMEDISGGGRTVLFVSHNMQAVTRLCPRSILLNGGRIQAVGSSPEMVSIYMDSEKGTRPEYRWPDLKDAPGDAVVRLCAVRARTEEGRVTDAFDIRKPVGLEIEYEVLEPGYAFMSYFRVINEEGVYVFTTIENDPSWRKRPRPIGRYTSTAWIPGNFMAEGIFYVGTCGIWGVNPTFKRARATYPVAFQMIDSRIGEDTVRVDYHESMLGVVMPWLDWKTQLNPVGHSMTVENMVSEEKG
jgi:lipopolysaccharide transport system ATP-binding protein